MGLLVRVILRREKVVCPGARIEETQATLSDGAIAPDIPLEYKNRQNRKEQNADEPIWFHLSITVRLLADARQGWKEVRDLIPGGRKRWSFFRGSKGWR